jgi:hypothetical protein
VNDTLKAAVIGVGMGMYHAENYQKTPGVELAALCDADPDRLQKAAERLGVTQTFTDHRDLLETDVDVVSVALPNFLHAPIAIDLLRRHRHALRSVRQRGRPGVSLEFWQPLGAGRRGDTVGVGDNGRPPAGRGKCPLARSRCVGLVLWL